MPGFLVGLQTETRGVASKIMNNLRALALRTVPKIAVVVRKSHGQACLNLGGGEADALAVAVSVVPNAVPTVATSSPR